MKAFLLLASLDSDISSPQCTNGLDSRLISQTLMDFLLKASTNVSLFLRPAHRIDIKCNICFYNQSHSETQLGLENTSHPYCLRPGRES